MAKIKGKTKAGFEFEVDSNAGDNMEFLDALVEADENPAYFSKVVTILLGREQKKKLYDSVRDKNGVVHVEAVSNALVDIFDAMGNGVKNS